MPIINEDECIAAGLDPKDVRRIALGIERYGKQAAKLGIEFFGGSGTCTMRFYDDKSTTGVDTKYGKLIIAHLHGFSCDGGHEEAQFNPPDGLMRALL